MGGRLLGTREYICICMFFEPTFFFHINAFKGEGNHQFSKILIKKKGTIQSHVKCPSLLTSCVLCSSINWPCTLVNSNACILQVFTTLTQSKKKNNSNFILRARNTRDICIPSFHSICFFLLLLLLFFLSGFSFKDTDDSQDNRGRDRNIQAFILQLCV